MSSTTTMVVPGLPPGLTRVEWILYVLSRRWIFIFGVLMGLYVGLPFLAPILMKLGWDIPARVIYTVYSFLCHQLPERSFFLFGQKFTYSLSDIQAAWRNTFDPLILRRFAGNPTLGWKVAWSDRMVSMYTSIWLFGLLWWQLRSRLKPLPWRGLLLFMLPMTIDGISHVLSDLAGVDQGFRASNVWLADLTRHLFPARFYVGDAWGSFNSAMRLLTGALFGLGIVWFGFPYVNDAISQVGQSLESRIKPAGQVSPYHLNKENLHL